MYKFVAINLSLLFIILFINTCKTKQSKTAVPLKNTAEIIVSETHLSEAKAIVYIPPPPDSLSEITINLVGDLMCHKPQTTNAEVSLNVYDFNPSFEYVKPYLQNADITIGNLETTFAGPSQPYSGYPAFNSPDAYCEAIKNAGFDFLVTANNHSMDTREEGILRTIDIIKKNKLGYAGTYLNQRDHDSIRILTIKGIQLAILNYTYGTNGAYPSSEHKYLLNLIDSSIVTTDIKTAKQKGADIVLVFYHMGLENVTEPTSAQKDAVRFAIDAGASMVIGAHPHMIGPTKVMYSPITKDTVFIAYSLGNFLSNQYWRYTDAGVILKLTIQKNHTHNKTSYKSASYIPTWVYRGDGAKKMHILFPAQWVSDSTKLPDFITKNHQQKMAEAYTDTKNILTKYTTLLQVDSLK